MPVDVRELAIHRKVSRMDYSRRRAETRIAAGFGHGDWIFRDEILPKWDVDSERNVSVFDAVYDAAYYRKLLEMHGMRLPLCRARCAVVALYVKMLCYDTSIDYGGVNALIGHPHLQTVSGDYASMQSIQLRYPKKFI